MNTDEHKVTIHKEIERKGENTQISTTHIYM